jgi:hypothetical protein
MEAWLEEIANSRVICTEKAPVGGAGGRYPGLGFHLLYFLSL